MPASRPDPEVVAKPKRRTYTAEYKQRILQEAEVAATTRGGLGALLRREGLYSSLLTYWRRERAHGILEALTPQKRGPKSKRNPMEEEVQKLRRQNARLTEDLRKAHIIIDVQKKGEFGLYSGRQKWDEPPFLPVVIVSERSSPSRYAASRRKTGAPLTAAGRSEPVPLMEGKGKDWERQPR